MTPNVSLKLSCICLGLTVSSQAATVALIDFGSSNNQTESENLSGSVRYWNNVTQANEPVVNPLQLITPGNTSSGISLLMSNENPTITNKAFQDPNSTSLSVSTGESLARFYPNSATGDTLYGYTTADTGSFTNPTGAVTLVFSGLTVGQSYDFYGMAGRTSTGDRRTTFDFVGQNTKSTDHNPSGGTSNASNSDVFNVTGVMPDANGKITLTVTADEPNNNTAQNFFYLGALEIVTVPEPSAAALLLLGSCGFLLRRKR